MCWSGSARTRGGAYSALPDLPAGLRGKRRGERVRESKEGGGEG